MAAVSSGAVGSLHAATTVAVDTTRAVSHVPTPMDINSLRIIRLGFTVHSFGTYRIDDHRGGQPSKAALVPLIGGIALEAGRARRGGGGVVGAAALAQPSALPADVAHGWHC